MAFSRSERGATVLKRWHAHHWAAYPNIRESPSLYFGQAMSLEVAL